MFPRRPGPLRPCASNMDKAFGENGAVFEGEGEAHPSCWVGFDRGVDVLSVFYDDGVYVGCEEVDAADLLA